MKIVQITAVTEHYESGNEDHGTWAIHPHTDATVYGLGDDNLLYYWGVVKTTYVSRSKEELEEDPELSDKYEVKEYGWKLSGS